MITASRRRPVRNVSSLHWQGQVSRMLFEWPGTPSTVTDAFRWLAASVTGHVQSQAKLCPRDQGIVVTPYGFLLSQCDSLTRSRRERISAETAVCLAMRPFDLLQLRPWSPLMSIVPSHTHRCSAHTGAPRRRAFAMRRDLSSIRVPITLIEMACRKAPACCADTANFVVYKLRYTLFHIYFRFQAAIFNFSLTVTSSYTKICPTMLCDVKNILIPLKFHIYSIYNVRFKCFQFHVCHFYFRLNSHRIAISSGVFGILTNKRSNVEFASKVDLRPLFNCHQVHHIFTQKSSTPPLLPVT